MPGYCLYIHGKDGGLIGPGIRIAADNDEAAIEKATLCVKGLDWELCDGTRIVKQVRHDKLVPSLTRSTKSSGWNPTP